MEKREILYDGYMYDVTSFIHKHPGGDVIEFYTKRGEDATIPILQFHDKSMKRVNFILKSLDRRVATFEDYSMTVEKKKLHDDMTSEYLKLLREFEAEGLFKPTYWKNIATFLEIIAWLVVGAYLIRYCNERLLMKAVGIVMVALGMSRSSLLEHEGGHNSITGKPKVDKFLQNIFFGMFVGISAKLWVKKHSTHHAMPQRVGYDRDMEMLPYLALYEGCITDPTSFWQNNWFLRNQLYVLVPLFTLLYVPLISSLFSPVIVLYHGYIDEVITHGLHFAIGISSIGLAPFLIAKLLSGIYLINIASLNHVHMPSAKESTHWIEYCTKHTANTISSPFNDWFTLLLNYQMEHHLFPTMPQHNLRQIVGRTKKLAAKFNLPYKTFTLLEAEMEVMKHMYNIMIHVRNVCKNKV